MDIETFGRKERLTVGLEPKYPITLYHLSCCAECSCRILNRTYLKAEYEIVCAFKPVDVADHRGKVGDWRSH